MSKVYVKTTWVDNQTPVNAANLNKIENAISSLASSSVTPSDVVSGNGVNVSITSDQKLELSVASNVQTSVSCSGIEVIVGDPVNPVANKMYYVLNLENKLQKIMFNDLVIYEVE